MPRLDNLDFFLQCAKTIAFTGAGGKTSLMRWIADFFSENERRTILTTTTKFALFLDLPHFFENQYADFFDFIVEIKNSLQQHQIVVVAHSTLPDQNKCVGISSTVLVQLQHLVKMGAILVEADGAARKPLKSPANHEPVISKNTDLCIGVIGLDGLGQPLSEKIVHRALLFSQITGCKLGENISIVHLEKLITHPKGLFKSCPERCEKHVFLNKYDTHGFLLDQSITGKNIFQESTIKFWTGSARKRYIFPLFSIDREYC